MPNTRPAERMKNVPRWKLAGRSPHPCLIAPSPFSQTHTHSHNARNKYTPIYEFWPCEPPKGPSARCMCVTCLLNAAWLLSLTIWSFLLYAFSRSFFTFSSLTLIFSIIRSLNINPSTSTYEQLVNFGPVQTHNAHNTFLRDFSKVVVSGHFCLSCFQSRRSFPELRIV